MAKHTNKSGNISNNLTSIKWTPLASILVGAIVFVYFLPFIAHTILDTYGFHHSRPKAYFTACREQLKNVGSGLEQQIAEKDSLIGIKSEDDVCHHILPGYSKPKKCIGKVKERIYEVCLKDSYNIKIIGKFGYEIRAQSNDKSQCKICVTESAVRPKMYDPTGECTKFSCIHTKE